MLAACSNLHAADGALARDLGRLQEQREKSGLGLTQDDQRYRAQLADLAQRADRNQDTQTAAIARSLIAALDRGPSLQMTEVFPPNSLWTGTRSVNGEPEESVTFKVTTVTASSAELLYTNKFGDWRMNLTLKAGKVHLAQLVAKDTRRSPATFSKILVSGLYTEITGQHQVELKGQWTYTMPGKSPHTVNKVHFVMNRS